MSRTTISDFISFVYKKYKKKYPFLKLLQMSTEITYPQLLADVYRNETSSRLSDVDKSVTNFTIAHMALLQDDDPAMRGLVRYIFINEHTYSILLLFLLGNFSR